MPECTRDMLHAKLFQMISPLLEQQKARFGGGRYALELLVHVFLIDHFCACVCVLASMLAFVCMRVRMCESDALVYCIGLLFTLHFSWKLQ